MPKPYKKGSLAHKRAIMAEGAWAYDQGLPLDWCLYGSFQPTLRQWFQEGWKARQLEQRKEVGYANS